jgi:hypothetical protein
MDRGLVPCDGGENRHQRAHSAVPIDAALQLIETDPVLRPPI